MRTYQESKSPQTQKAPLIEGQGPVVVGYTTILPIDFLAIIWYNLYVNKEEV